MKNFKVMYQNNQLLCSACEKETNHMHITPYILNTKTTPWFCQKCRKTNLDYLIQKQPTIKRNINFYIDSYVMKMSIKEITEKYYTNASIVNSGIKHIIKILHNGITMEQIQEKINEYN